MRFAPLALLLAAPLFAGFTCNINVPGDGDGDSDCPALDEVCPNLQCADGFAQDEDGCSICECADPIADAGSPDDAGAVVTCSADFDCGPGERCDVVNFCESACPDGQMDCPTVCLGRCVEDQEPPPGCIQDSDCGPNQVCVFDGGGACDPATGTTCDPPEGGLVAPSGICVDVQTSACASDFDCAPGFVCSFDGGSTGGAAPCDPNSSDCDARPAPLPEGRCVESEPTDAGSEPIDGGAAPGCFSDEDCPNGFCEVPACASLDCPASQCVFPVCDDDSQAICAMAEPQCAPGQTAAIVTGCWECLDARTCAPVCDATSNDCG